MEWGFDGKQHRVWLMEDNTVALDLSQGQQAPTALPNPFFVALAFLFDRDAFADRLSLDRVTREAARLTAGAQEELSPTERRLTVTTHGGTRTTIDLRLTDGVWLPVRMIREIEGAGGPDDPSHQQTIELRDYERTGRLHFPRTLSMRSSDLEAGARGVVDFTVTLLEIDTTIPAEAFTVVGDASSRLRLTTDP